MYVNNSSELKHVWEKLSKFFKSYRTFLKPNGAMISLIRNSSHLINESALGVNRNDLSKIFSTCFLCVQFKSIQIIAIFHLSGKYWSCNNPDGVFSGFQIIFCISYEKTGINRFYFFSVLELLVLLELV
jgi:hypothetical protein